MKYFTAFFLVFSSVSSAYSERGYFSLYPCNETNYKEYVFDSEKTKDLIGRTGSGCYLVGANLSGEDLSGADFSQAKLQGANLTEANLTGASFEEADWSGVDFTDANLSGVDLSREDLAGITKLSLCSLVTVRLKARLYNKAHFTYAIYDQETDLPGDDVRFRAYFRMKYYKSCNNDNFQDYIFNKTATDELIKFANKRKKGCYLDGVDLSGEDLSGAYLREALINNSKLEGTNFSGAYLREADIANSKLEGANFSGADSKGAYFGASDARETNFSGADLERVNFSRTDVGGANFSGANLKGADLWKIFFEGQKRVTGMMPIDFTHAIYNDETNLPGWFDWWLKYKFEMVYRD